MASNCAREGLSGTDSAEIQLPRVPYPFSYSKRDETEMSGGLCLMEVFNITFYGLDKLKPENQIGTIKVIDEYGREYCLYELVKECAENLPSIENNGQLLQTGPADQSLPGDVAFSFDVHLSGGVYMASIPIDALGESSDFKYREISIESEDGSCELSVLLGQFAFAFEAHVKLEVHPPTIGYVHGLVAARTSLLEHPMFTSTLFYTKESHKRKLAAGKIPLFKSIVAVPMDCKLYVCINMFINDVVVDGVINLNPKPSGHCDTEFLPLGSEGKGCMKLTVTWMGGSVGLHERSSGRPHIESRGWLK